jgi:hypothetical protein
MEAVAAGLDLTKRRKIWDLKRISEIVIHAGNAVTER